MSAHPLLSLVTPHLNLSQFIALSFYCPISCPVQESSTFHIPDTQSVCSVGLTTARANLCSLLWEYHRILFTGYEPRFSAAHASGIFVDPELEQQLRILHKAPQIHFYSTQRFSALL